MRAMNVAVGVMVLVSVAADAGPCPTRSSWPTTAWPDKTAQTTAAKGPQIKALEDALFTLTGADGDRKGIRTDGLLIIKGGELIYEKYARGFAATNRHLSWSVAKSYTSVLTGVAVQQGALSLDDSICKYLKQYEGQSVCEIQVKHPLTFGSGLGWQEGYEDEPYQLSSVISMFFGEGHKDQLKHILSHRRAYAPNEKWWYSTGDSQLLATVVKRALEAAGHGKDAFWTLLFNRIGSGGLVLEEDALGTVQGGSHLFATPRDFARLGYLMLNDGCWNGERLLPEGWVAASTTPSEVYVKSADKSEKLPSGYSWWLNRPVPAREQPKPWADAPEDAYAALGHWGQRIIVVPSLDLVIVRTGDDREGSVDPNLILKHALEVAR